MNLFYFSCEILKTMSDNNHYFETNRATWNTKVKEHSKSDMYNIKAFKEGNVSAVEEYVIRDVDATHKLFEKLKGYII